MMPEEKNWVTKNEAVKMALFFVRSACDALNLSPDVFNDATEKEIFLNLILCENKLKKMSSQLDIK